MHEHFDPGLLAFLRDVNSYPHGPREIRELHTHASLVFVVPPWVYKIKKPVDFGFLDFSTLGKRRYYCEREVLLNSRLAPGVYLGVVPITRSGGGYAIGGDGEVIEYAVKMKELDASGFLDVRIAAGKAGEEELERVAAVLDAFYRKQSSSPEIAEWGRVAKLRISTDENFSQSAGFVGKTISSAAYEAIRKFTGTCYGAMVSLFDERVKSGWIRDCHGDLHLDHIHVTDDELQIYDCIEFNDRLRHLDVASDVAFLAMDLDFHGRPDLSRFFTRRIAGLLNDAGMSGVMDFYKCYRAYVRGKVEGFHSVVELGDDSERMAAAERARRYFQLALQYAVCGSEPTALVFMGRVASGKSTLAEAISGELGWHLVSSDERRKRLAGVPLFERGDAESRGKLYSADASERVYDSIVREARDTLRSGHGVVLDATFSKRSYRDGLRRLLEGYRVKWFVMEADEASAAARLEQREGMPDVVSDARAEDRLMLDAAFEPPDEVPQVDKRVVCTRGPAVEVLRKLLVGMAVEAGSKPENGKGRPGEPDRPGE